jgi:hypothetical protein
MSNLSGADFSAVSAASGFGAISPFVGDLARVGALAAAFAAVGFDTGLVDFTATLLKTGLGWSFGFVVGCATFLGAAALGVAFFGSALPGFLADGIGFFEGIFFSAS